MYWSQRLYTNEHLLKRLAIEQVRFHHHEQINIVQWQIYINILKDRQTYPQTILVGWESKQATYANLQIATVIFLWAMNLKLTSVPSVLQYSLLVTYAREGKEIRHNQPYEGWKLISSKINTKIQKVVEPGHPG